MLCEYNTIHSKSRSDSLIKCQTEHNFLVALRIHVWDTDDVTKNTTIEKKTEGI